MDFYRINTSLDGYKYIEYEGFSTCEEFEEIGYEVELVKLLCINPDDFINSYEYQLPYMQGVSKSGELGIARCRFLLDEASGIPWYGMRKLSGDDTDFDEELEKFEKQMLEGRTYLEIGDVDMDTPDGIYYCDLE